VIYIRYPIHVCDTRERRLQKPSKCVLCVSLQMYQCQCLSVSTDVSVSMSVSVPVFYTYAHLNIYTCVKFESDIDIPNLCV